MISWVSVWRWQHDRCDLPPRDASHAACTLMIVLEQQEFHIIYDLAAVSSPLPD